MRIERHKDDDNGKYTMGTRRRATCFFGNLAGGTRL